VRKIKKLVAEPSLMKIHFKVQEVFIDKKLCMLWTKPAEIGTPKKVYALFNEPFLHLDSARKIH
jgi:hypothetical protein